jgi:hypothetical protein
LIAICRNFENLLASSQSEAQAIFEDPILGSSRSSPIHQNLRVKSFVAKQLYPISFADQYSFVKVSGR